MLFIILSPVHICTSQVKIFSSEQEVQNLTTKLGHRREVQSIIVTSGVEVAQVQSVVLLGGYTGTFKLVDGGKETGRIWHNASAAEMKAAIKALPNVYGDVEVTVLPLNTFGGRTWNITFLEGKSNGEGLVVVDVSGLSGSGDKARVIELEPGQGIPLSGNFTLSMDLNQDGTCGFWTIFCFAACLFEFILSTLCNVPLAQVLLISGNHSDTMRLLLQ